MRYTLLLFLLIVLFSGCTDTQKQKEEVNTRGKVDIIAENLSVPWSLAFLPDKSMIFTERTGDVKLIRNDLVHTIAKINSFASGEGGLLGITTHPDFQSNNLIYIYYTYRTPEGKLFNKVSKFVFLDDKLTDEKTVIDSIPASSNHNGGRIKFGPDKLLYIGSGDAEKPQNAQDIRSLSGKILRVRDDGSIPEGNPYPNSPVYSYGHRNPQGLAWHKKTGKLYESEHGAMRHDEINFIEANKNYMWPIAECKNPDSSDPAILCYPDFTIAPSGMAFYNNDLYVATLRGTQVRKVKFNDDGSKVLLDEAFLLGYGRIRDVVLGPENYLYITTNNRDGRGFPNKNDDLIIRVKPE